MGNPPARCALPCTVTSMKGHPTGRLVTSWVVGSVLQLVLLYAGSALVVALSLRAGEVQPTAWLMYVPSVVTAVAAVAIAGKSQSRPRWLRALAAASVPAVASAAMSAFALAQASAHVSVDATRALVEVGVPVAVMLAAAASLGALAGARSQLDA